MGEWRKVRLDQCCEIVGGATPSTTVDDYWGGDICWATPKDLSELTNALITDTPRKLTKSGLASCSADVLPVGSVLFSSRAPIGHVAINTVPMATNQGFKSFIPMSGQVDAAFLYWWLRTNRTYLEGLGNGATFKEVSKAIVSRIEIRLPPISDQRRIAKILDAAEALRAKRRIALAEIETLAQAIFLDMFGDPVSNPLTWPLTKFEDLCTRVTVGIVVQPASYYVSEGVPALRSLNVRPGKIDQDNLVFFSNDDNNGPLAKTKLKTGDLVLVRSGQPGTAAVVPAELDGVNAIDILIATPLHKSVDATFLCCFFNSSGGRDLVLSKQRGQIQKHLNVGSLNEALIPTPPVTAQREFARRIAAVERLKSAHRASLAELDALFASLQHRAFRGEL
jgi:type I restriction enzyme S subunit